MTSLRRTVFVWLSALLLATGCLAAAVAYFATAGETDNLLDSQLRQIAYYVGDAPRTQLLQTPQDPAYDPEDDFLVQIWDGNGETPQTSDPSVAIPRREETGFSNASMPDEEWRTYTRAMAGRTVQVSQRMAVREELAANSALHSALPILLLLPLSWFFLGFLIDRALRRLDKLAEDVSQRTAADRRTIPLGGVPSEVAPFVAAMNDLFRRLQAAVDQQRRFVSDAAHELRTPLAALTLQVDNLKSATSRNDMLARAADVEAGTRRASVLVAQLLRLARYEGEVEGGRREAVDIVAVTRECIADLAPLAAQVGTSVEFEAHSAGSVQGEAQDLKILISNLLDNAVRHTPGNGRVEIVSGLSEGCGFLAITDAGPGIPEHLMERVFERFFRVAGQDVEGSGLGLAIAGSIAQRHDIALVLENRRDQAGLIAKLIFPPQSALAGG